MKEDLSLLSQTALFRGISPEELSGLLQCLSAFEKRYQKYEMILAPGSSVHSVGILLSGGAQIVREDGDGTRSILSELIPSDLFAEAYAAAGWREIPITVFATNPSRVLWIPFHKIIAPCASSCTYHKVLIENLVQIIAQKNILMNEKMRLVSCKTTREKLLTYFRDYAAFVGRPQFNIPFSRNELADYLSVDRSAMSREMGKLRDDGLIRFVKNKIELL